MSLKNDQIISAQVLLHSASGKEISGETAITSDNISEYTPSSDTVAQATEALTKLGFEVGEMVGISMAITAPASTFRRVFHIELRQRDDGAIQAVPRGGSPSLEIPRAGWPRKLARLAVAITFVPPPEFGPRDFFAL